MILLAALNHIFFLQIQVPLILSCWLHVTAIMVDEEERLNHRTCF